MGVYVGIDWADQEHVISCLRSDRSVIAEFAIEHNEAGFELLASKILGWAKTDEVLIGIETASNLISDFLLDAGFRVALVHPNRIHGIRRQRTSSGAKSDQDDARAIARYLVNEEDRLEIITPDSDVTIALRHLVSERRATTTDRTRCLNRIRSILKRHNPAALGHFSCFSRKIYMALLRAFPTHEALAKLTVEEIRSFIVEHRYYGKRSAEEIHAKIQEAPNGSDGLAAKAGRIALEVELDKLATLVAADKKLQATMAELLELHCDGEIFTSIPGADTATAAALICTFGDDRSRFRDAESLASLIGITPVTRASGKYRSVQFRRSCRRDARQVFHIWVNGTRRSQPWAEERYQALKAAGKSHALALRILGRSWLRILHACWKHRTRFDPARVQGRISNVGA